MAASEPADQTNIDDIDEDDVAELDDEFNYDDPNVIDYDDPVRVLLAATSNPPRVDWVGGRWGAGDENHSHLCRSGIMRLLPNIISCSATLHSPPLFLFLCVQTLETGCGSSFARRPRGTSSDL